MKQIFATPRTRSFTMRIIMCALALSAQLVASAQQTVFFDTFGASSLDQTNIVGGIPGGTSSDATPYSATSYTIGSAKDARATSLTSGHLKLIQGATSSGNLDAQAFFTKYPVKLQSVGDYIELTYTFTETPPILQSFNSTASALFVGLFDSHGSAPWTNNLQNSAYDATKSDAVSGHTANWSGFNAQLYNGAGSRIYARPVQTSVANNYNQSLLYNYPTAAGNGGASNNPSLNLTAGQPYTMQLRVTLSAVGTLAVSNALYAGTDSSGTILFSTQWANVTGANVTTNFDGFAMGYRANNTGFAGSWTNDVNSIKIVASLAAQAGPYYFVTSSGDPCFGGVTVGLSGSAATNSYMLFTNGAYAGTIVTGTGAAISFGVQSAPGLYTVIATNTATLGAGPMFGSASVFAPGVTINTQPSSVTVVTNLPTSFSVQATGASLSYQWYKNGVALVNGGTISGAQTPTLNISAVQAGDAATSGNGYTVVVQTPCANIVTSSPPAALTLAAPRNLIWAGANPDNTWDFTELNFTLSASPVIFGNGDNVAFDNSSPNQSLAISNTITPTLITVSGTAAYTFGGPSKITGVAKLVDSSSGTLSILNNNDYTGGTIISNGATLALGDGGTAANNGSLAGTVTVASGGTLNYNFAGSANSTATLNHGLAGNGTVNCSTASGSTIATFASAVSSNFSGIINVNGFTALHAVANPGYAFGSNSTVNVVQDGGQVWLDTSSTVYNNTFNIIGLGYPPANPVTTPAYGAIRIFNCTITAPVNLLGNARIGGTINGGTLQGVVSGPYQLEVWGTTNSFVLVMGPTNGSPQAYASTLITAGAIRAANSNAISSGPLTVGEGGDMQVFGNNVTVSNLSSTISASGGLVALAEGPRVRNMNASTNGTLTVGTDGSNSQFDGTFSDGAAASLGLTKVGAGTLTLTLLSSNTGPVTVSVGTVALSGTGAFNKAPIQIGSGAFFDVSGIGGTLTLNSAQFLKGNGTLSGTLAAPAGSIVQPGLPMGTLTVSGSATVNGIYRANLNRTNVTNCSKFTSAGTTFSGATLSVTNVGPKLQTGDFFQLFPGATAGFTTIQLQTNDVANNAKYTWNNTVASDGRVTVATVSFIINPSPTNIVTSVTNFVNGVTNGLLTLSWPTDYTGWTLQSQTNALNKGLGTNWADVAGSATTNKVIVPIVSTNGSLFYRMKF